MSKFKEKKQKAVLYQHMSRTLIFAFNIRPCKQTGALESIEYRFQILEITGIFYSTPNFLKRFYCNKATAFRKICF